MALGGQRVPLERHVGGGDPRRQAVRRAERVEARRTHAWALAVGGDGGAKLLTGLGPIDPVFDCAIESGS